MRELDIHPRVVVDDYFKSDKWYKQTSDNTSSSENRTLVCMDFWMLRYFNFVRWSFSWKKKENICFVTWPKWCWKKVSINEEILQDNSREKSLITQRLIYDSLQYSDQKLHDFLYHQNFTELVNLSIGGTKLLWYYPWRND